MKRSAAAARLAAEGGEGGGGAASKKVKSLAGGGGDADGGTSEPHSPILPGNNTSSSASDSGMTVAAEKSLRLAGKGGGKGGAAKKGTAPRIPVASPLGSDDEGENEGKARGGGGGEKGEGGQEEDDDEEERMENLEFGKYNSVDLGQMQQVLNRFTSEQMSRYECYRRSGFQRANMRRVLGNVAGCPISIPMTIVMSGISKMFVGELVEIGRIVMTERNDVGPIRPTHIREAYRRLRLEGKVPLRGRPPLFR